MISRLLKPIAIACLIVILAPSVFFAVPQRADAFLGFGDIVFDPSNLVQNTISAVANPTTAFSSLGTFTYSTILVPIVRGLIRAILMKMTASVINWINGSNGTGQPSYVLNISAHLQNLGDSIALPFLNQIANNLNSPFGTAIAVALRKSYTQQTSMGGFLDANKCNLSESSTNVPAFLAGNWSQGGVGAWFSLTTTKNNPYMLYQAAQSQLGSNVNQAQTNRRQDLLQSSGFLSWCGSSDAAAQKQAVALTAMTACATTPGNTPAYCDKVYANAGGAVGGISPGDTCTNKDGTPGKVQTPGSVIHDYTQKAVVASGFDQLISANDLDGMFSQIINALLNKVLGTAGGLLGASSGGSSSIVSQLGAYTPDISSATSSASQTAQSVSTQITAYTNAWSIIANAANAAKANLTSLQNLCTTNATAASTTDPIFIATATAEAAVAQSALTSKVAPVLTSSLAAFATASTTQAFALKVQTESQSASASATVASDLSTLIRMPPSMIDIANVQTDASATGGSNANPIGSLTVSGGTLVDQMNLISANAIALKASVCTISPDSIM